MPLDLFLGSRLKASLLKDHQLKYTLVDMLVPRRVDQWLFLVPVKGGRWHIIPQLTVYTTYIPLIYCLLGAYMLPTTFYGNQKQPWSRCLLQNIHHELKKTLFFRWGSRFGMLLCLSALKPSGFRFSRSEVSPLIASMMEI